MYYGVNSREAMCNTSTVFIKDDRMPDIKVNQDGQKETFEECMNYTSNIRLCPDGIVPADSPLAKANEKLFKIMEEVKNNSGRKSQ